MIGSSFDSIATYRLIAKDHRDAYSPDTVALIDQYASRPHIQPAFTPLYYLLDYSTGKYVFLSPGLESVSGHRISYLKDAGIEFFSSRYHPEDLTVVQRHIFREFRLFLQQYPSVQHRDFICSYNLRFRNRKGELVSVMQHHSMIQSTAAGTPMLSFGFIYPADCLLHENRNLFSISRVDPATGFSAGQPLMQRCFYHRLEDALLTRKEKEVLKWISDGLSSKQIADRMHVSIHTIHNHRKNMFQKTNSGN
ncbi:MAG: helix-turn-helix transcriptional regulator, partial [Bacteroidota bacterium]